MANPGPFDKAGTAMSLADAIRAQAAKQSELAQQDKAKSGLVDTSNPLDQLMKQLQDIHVAATPYDQLLSQAQNTAGMQFDPLIKELQGQMKATTNRGHANQKQAKQMYGDLATDIAAQLPEITNQMNAASKESQGQYDQAQAAMKQEYDQQSQQQQDLYKKLGIQAAAPEATSQAATDQSYFQNQSNLDEANALALLNQMKQSDVSYNQQSSNNTRLAGDNAAQDIGAQLEDYLQQASGKLGGLNAGKSSAVAAMLAQLQQSDAQRVSDSESQQYSQLMDLANFQLKMQQQQADSQASPLFKGTNGTQGAANYLGGVYGSQDSFTPSAIMDAINDVMGNKNVIAGKYDSGEKDMYGNPVMTKVNESYLEDLLRRRMSSSGQGALSGTQFSDMDINTAINALLARQGQLK